MPKVMSGSFEQYKGKNGCYVDHLGNYYSKVTTMAECWGVQPRALTARISYGYTLEEALMYNCKVDKPKKDTSVVWVFGEPFPDYRAVDRAYGFVENTLSRHKDDLERYLMELDYYFIDGKLYRTSTALAMAYGLAQSTVYGRLLRGWTLEQAVSSIKGSAGRKPSTYVDHLGNEYDGFYKMLYAYGITTGCYYGRKKKGWSLEQILTTPMKRVMDKEPDRVKGTKLKKGSKIQ